MWLRRVDGTRLKAVLSPASQGAKVERAAPFTTPWRTLQIADSAGALYMASDLILNLNEPNELGDVSWFKPAKYVGIWWGMHLDTRTLGLRSEARRDDGEHAALHRLRREARLSRRAGRRLERRAGTATGSRTARPSASRSRIRISTCEGLAEYAKRKGVRLIGHHETSGQHRALRSSSSQPALDLYQRLGIDSVKTGYVADAGGVKARGDDGKIHFEWHDGQVMSRHHLKVVTEAAKRHIAVNRARADQGHGPAAHLSELGRARRRARHGVQRVGRSAEPARARSESRVHAHARRSDGLHAGRAEPEGQGRSADSNRRSRSSWRSTSCSTARSRWPRTCPRTTRAIPRRSSSSRTCRPTGRETLVLNGEVGDYVTIVRKDRNSDDWYLGSVTDENARTLEVKLDFLDADRTLSRADLSRRRERRLAHAPVRNRDRAPRRPPRRHAAAETRARRRPGHSLPGAVNAVPERSGKLSGAAIVALLSFPGSPGTESQPRPVLLRPNEYLTRDPQQHDSFNFFPRYSCTRRSSVARSGACSGGRSAARVLLRCVSTRQRLHRDHAERRGRAALSRARRSQRPPLSRRRSTFSRRARLGLARAAHRRSGLRWLPGQAHRVSSQGWAVGHRTARSSDAERRPRSRASATRCTASCSRPRSRRRSSCWYSAPVRTAQSRTPTCSTCCRTTGSRRSSTTSVAPASRPAASRSISASSPTMRLQPWRTRASFSMRRACPSA